MIEATSVTRGNIQYPVGDVNVWLDPALLRKKVMVQQEGRLYTHPIFGLRGNNDFELADHRGETAQALSTYRQMTITMENRLLALDVISQAFSHPAHLVLTPLARLFRNQDGVLIQTLEEGYSVDLYKVIPKIDMTGRTLLSVVRGVLLGLSEPMLTVNESKDGISHWVAVLTDEVSLASTKAYSNGDGSFSCYLLGNNVQRLTGTEDDVINLGSRYLDYGSPSYGLLERYNIIHETFGCDPD